MTIPSRPRADLSSLTGGRFGELSALHLSAKTARLLDLWAADQAHAAPIFVAVNVKGWFVATALKLPVSPPWPDDLDAALRFGRSRGFAYLLFHCDAPLIAELPRHMW